MKNAQHFNIKFEELVDEKQEAIIDALEPALQKAAEAEGNEFLKREWHDPKPETWQEAYCRIYALSTHQWQEDIEQRGQSFVPPFMWEVWQEEHVRHLAREKAIKAFTLTEIEVAL